MRHPMEAAGKAKKLFHLVIGTPDLEHCPICRAHVQGKADPKLDGATGPVLVQELHPDEILRCSCPLCVQVRKADL
ncbi:MAG TPA: hypothetical protein VKU80_04180 [Planctomycetota bacterium]|nr:hypothetical protein [Planctomycetota bacterium]